MTGGMMQWPEISCLRGHDWHASITHEVDLGKPHGYGDLPAIPERFARHFSIDVFDWKQYGEDGPWCPGHDAVSETIVTQGIWEPAETVLTLAACEAAPRDHVLLDFGAQVGWYSLLALSCGLAVNAYDADPEPLRLLAHSAAANGWDTPGRLLRQTIRFGPDTPLYGPSSMPIAVAKIDVEGAETDVLRSLRPAIESGLVANLLVEITPMFGPGYPEMVAELIDSGYRAWRVPDKSYPPARLDDLHADLESWRLDTLSRSALLAEVARWWQVNCWFQRKDVTWA